MRTFYFLSLFLLITGLSYCQEISISFPSELSQANENDGTINLPVTISEAGDVTATVELVITNDQDDSFEFMTQTLEFTAGTTEIDVPLTLLDNDTTNKDYFVAISLTELIGAIDGDFTDHTVYVLDDEAHAPEATDVLGMTLNNSLEVAGAEIVAYDAGSQKLFVSNAGDAAVEIIDYSDPTAPVEDSSIVFSNFGEEVTSVSAYNGFVAVAVKAADQGNGKVVFMDTNGTILSDVTAGSLPDMVTFTPDGTKVLVANEGEPNDDYTVDPEGTISIIDVSGGIDTLTDANVTTLTFNAFDADQAALEAAGVRIFGPGASVSQDLEPEFITISEDGLTAYVSLQENNAYAVVDIEGASITAVESWGYKDHSLAENAFDVSNRLDFVFISTWNTLGMYQPDAIANYTVDGTNYIVIANEGDARDYDGFSEEERVRDLDLDPTVYPNADFLQINENLGRLKTTSATGDTDGDGDIDQIYSYGGRSFSIVNADSGEVIYDSADLLERITKEDPVYGAIFNATDDENAFKNRSDDKGPEPEAVTLAQIEGNWYAFIGLERIGGIAVFDITNPTEPTFETYVNNRDTTLDDENPAGDLAPEGVIYIAPEDNATGTGLIIVANEVSSTITTYTLNNDVLSTEDFVQEQGIKIFPNPSEDGIFFFSQPAAYEIYDMAGRQLTKGTDTSNVILTNYSKGIYLVKFDNGSSQKIILK